MAIQDLWDASHLKKKFLGHVLKLANVTTNPCLMWPHDISYIIKLRTQVLRSLRLL